MKKSFKRIFAIVIATMMIALMVPFTAYAAGPTLTLTTSNANFKFEVYKIAEIDTSTGKLTVEDSNGDTINGYLKQDGSKDVTADLIDACDAAKSLSKKLSDFVPSDTVTEATYDGAGIYYIKPIYNKTDGAPLIKKSSIAVVTSDTYVEIDESKVNDGQPTITKKITNVTNDRKFDKTNGEYATAQLDDDITYTLTASVPGSKSNPIVKYDIVDTYELGLTPDLTKDHVTVILNGNEIKDFNIINVDKGTFTVSLDPILFDVKEYDYDSYSQAKVEVIFKAKLNANATLGNNSNDNSDSLKYANNSDVSEDGKTTTDHDKQGPTVQVFCFGIKVNKVDSAGNNIKSSPATFKLTYGSNTKEESTGGTGVAEFKDIPVAAGVTYTIEEIEAPDGYILNTNAINLQIPELVVKVKETKTDEGKTDTVTDEGTTSPIFELDSSFEAPENWTFDAGIFATNVKNAKITVPSTGGVGTWMFTLGGAALIVLAGAMFIILKKKNTSK